MYRLNLEYEVLEPRILFAADQTNQSSDSSTTSDATFALAPPPPAAETHDVAPVDLAAASSAKDIVFISDAISGYETLVSAYSASHEVAVLDHLGDNLAQMVRILDGRTDLSTIYIVTEGSGSDIVLGTAHLTNDNIGQYSGELSQIGASLSSGGDIRFYGCSHDAGTDGQLVVEKIATLSAADIAVAKDAADYSFFGIDDPAAPTILKDGAAAATQAIENLLSSPDAAQRLKDIFAGSAESADPNRDALIDALIRDRLSSTSTIKIEIRSDAELAGALGAFAANSGDGTPKIFLNAKWLATASKLDVTRVLAEEYGHYLDNKINGAHDTPGDEGEVFSNVAVFGAPPARDVLAQTDNDHRILTIDGHYVDVETAIAREVSLVFTSGYFGTQGNNTNQANNIKNLSSVDVARVAFVQSDADGDGKFGSTGGTQGNDLAGTLKIYRTNGTVVSLTGALNWRETTGSTVEVFGFIFDTGQTATLGSSYVVRGGTTASTSTTLGLKAATSSFTFTDGSNRSGNAATSGLLSALNSYLATQPTVTSVTASSTNVVEGNNLVYTVALSTATTATTYFVFSTGGTATASSDYNSTFTFSNGVTLNADGTLSVPTGVTSFTITVATIDDAISENTETLDVAVGGRSETGSILDNDDTRTLTVTGLNDVSEGSQAIFTVTLSASVARATNISLAWANGYGANSATTSGDYVTTYGTSLTDTANTVLYYYASGVRTVLTVTNNVVELPANITTFYVRVPTVQDSAFEGKEDFRLTATIVGGNSGAGTSTIIDDGTGKVYSNIDSTGTALYSGTADDDRALSIAASGPVNEASQYAMFTITAETGKALSLTLGNTADTSDRDATISGFTTVEYWDGTAWQTYNGTSATVPTGGKLYVRVDISSERDSTFEGPETFTLTTAYIAGAARSVSAISTIRDDGNGNIYDGTLTSGLPTLDTVTALDNDAGLKVSFITVNEGSDWAVFKVDGNKDDVLTLSFSDGTTSGFSSIGSNFEVYVSAASGWQTYNPSSKPVVVEGVASSGTGSMFVRVRLTPEVDSVYESSETFTLTATKSGNISSSGTGTIVDDGTGNKYTGDISGGSATTANTSLDDDRPTLSVAGTDDVSEGSYAVFTVSLSNATKNDAVIDLALPGTSPDTANSSDYSSSYTVFYYDGATRHDLTVISNQITLPAGVTKFFVSVATTADTNFEGSESFTLQAGFNSAELKYQNGISGTLRTNASQSDTSTVLDDGTGRRYDGNVTISGNTVTLNTLSGSDDDRALTIESAGLVNEGSQYAMFTVTAEQNQTLLLTLGNTSSTTDRDATIGGFTLQYFDENANQWQTYDANHHPTVGPSGKVYVRVDIRTERDTVYEGEETFTLTAAYSTGNKSSSDTASIFDDGTGSLYDGTVANNGQANSTTNGADNDQTINVSGVTISESSPYAVFDVEATAGTTLTLRLESGTATIGTDTSSTFEYYDGSRWQPYSTNAVVPQGGHLLVRVAIVDDSSFERSETFKLYASDGTLTGNGTTTIVDDGSSGNTFRANNNTATPSNGPADNDQQVARPPQAPPAPVIAPPARLAAIPAVASAPISATVQNIGTSAAPVAAPVIAPTPLAPVAMQVPSFGGLIADRPEFSGNNFKVNVVASDASPGTTFSATLPDGSPLPAGITIDAATGQISGLTPQGASDITVRILATSSEGSRTLEIKIDFPDQRGALQSPQEFATLEDFARFSAELPVEAQTPAPVQKLSTFTPSSGLPSFSQRLQDLVLNASNA